jgi:glycosyltransferase involved in cell wall biosynthesis
MRITVIIPTFNRMHLLKEALDSVRQQTLSPEEILVVDDGSTDGTLKMLKKELNLRVLCQPNGGAARARNQGLSAASGDWVAFLDSDDRWEPTKLQKQVEAHERDPSCRWVICDSDAMDLNGVPLAGHHKKIESGAITKSLFLRTFVHTPSVLAERSMLLELGGFDERLVVCEDLDLWLRVSMLSNVAAVHEPLFWRRVHAASLAHADRPEHHEDKCLVLERFAEDPRARERISGPDRKRRLARVHFLAARAWKRHGDFAKAREHLHRSRQLIPFNPRYWPLVSSIT